MPGDKGFRYVYGGEQLVKVLDKIQKTGRPDKLTLSYMRDTWLLKNAQYGAVLDVLRDMGFIDASGVPMPLYNEYRNPVRAKTALAKGIRGAYPELFKAYPDAQTLNAPDLEGYFKQHTGHGPTVIQKILTTFRALCGQADFSGVSEIKEDKVEVEVPRGRKEQAPDVEPRLHVNIEIHIAADTPDDKIEAIFKNMKQYLFTV